MDHVWTCTACNFLLLNLSCQASAQIEMTKFRLIGYHVQHDSGGELIMGVSSSFLNFENVNRIPGTFHSACTFTNCAVISQRTH
jgi:hypothetical protein